MNAKDACTEIKPLESKLQEACQRICLLNHQEDIFNDFLNAEEQRILEDGTEEDCKQNKQLLESQTAFDRICSNGPNNIWRIAKHRNLPPRKVALDFALALDLISKNGHRKLTKEFVGEDVVTSAVAIKYHDGQLLINQKSVCSVRRTKTSKLDHILQSFDELVWQTASIDFSGSYETKQVADAVLALNQKQDALRFSVVAYTTIRWKMRDKAMLD